MKKSLFAIAVVALATASCAKDRTCTCTTTNSANSTSTTNAVILVESTNSQAKSNCISRTWTTTNGVTYTENCSLD